MIEFYKISEEIMDDIDRVIDRTDCNSKVELQYYDIGYCTALIKLLNKLNQYVDNDD